MLNLFMLRPSAIHRVKEIPEVRRSALGVGFTSHALEPGANIVLEDLHGITHERQRALRFSNKANESQGSRRVLDWDRDRTRSLRGISRRKNGHARRRKSQPWGNRSSLSKAAQTSPTREEDEKINS